ncbi:transglycosylase SLT domain-containing protein [Roseospira visakhapatnamensis]|uniref:Transglycosylase SLT domain-containing protein n=1 Tax=Roseospira visakhapatnamensis TaxID=390880 RepID=A0A7W6RGI5_9PROT|nr:hypothetical protein [Roseospira visakhapatnamensis]
MSGAPTQLIGQQLAGTVQLGGRTVGREVLAGIQDASHKIGVNFTYMLAKANQESGFRPDATNPRGTASGLFQFTRSTWLDQIAQHGEKHGLGDLSRQIVLDSRGRPRGRTPEAEARILALRSNPRVSAMMAAEYAAENKAYLEYALGRSADATDIYLAHFLGPGGAVSFLRGMARDPNASAARVLPQAAANNPTIFAHHGRPRSLRQVHGVLRATIQDAMRRFSGASQLTEASTPPAPPAVKPDAPAPSDRGWGVAGLRPAPAPGIRPEGPDRADLIPLHLAANPPAFPGPRPPAPDRADLIAPELAASMPPVPGRRPIPADMRAEEPQPDVRPVPIPAPETLVAEAPPPMRSPAGDTMVAQVLDATRAVEAAGAARKLDLPGPSALAMAAMLDDLVSGGDRTPDRVLVLDPVAGLTAMPAPTVAATPRPAVTLAALDPAPPRPVVGAPSGEAPSVAASPASDAGATWAVAGVTDAPAEAVHPAITRILAVGDSVSAPPGEARVSMPIPDVDRSRLSETARAPADALTAAVAAPRGGPPEAGTEATGARPSAPDADPAPRWRTASVAQLADSDASQAISAILGRPNAG